MQRLERGTKLVVASHNPGKVWEINQLIAPFGFEAVSAGALGLAEPEETEVTFAGNARLKAFAAAAGSGLPSLADDSGLEVDALDGAPGIYSARWAGPGKDFGAAMARIHDELEDCRAWDGAPPKANFISVLCLAWPDGQHQIFEGRIDGHLVWPPRGGNGFGYDPMFVAEGKTLTFGEMEPAAKYAISHRTRAFERFKKDCLEEPGTSEIGGAAAESARDVERLSAAAQNLSTKAELATFVGRLRRDLDQHSALWDNPELSGYLGRLEDCLGASDVADEPKWRTIAKALLAASRHK
jgi:XTP/dITP diphosphohydrolase